MFPISPKIEKLKFIDVSCQKVTLDDGSLFDMTRYSEDSHFHQSEADKVAILEFELRRATQTINSLRSELTQQVCR